MAGYPPNIAFSCAIDIDPVIIGSMFASGFSCSGVQPALPALAWPSLSLLHKNPATSTLS